MLTKTGDLTIFCGGEDVLEEGAAFAHAVGARIALPPPRATTSVEALVIRLRWYAHLAFSAATPMPHVFLEPEPREGEGELSTSARRQLERLALGYGAVRVGDAGRARVRHAGLGSVLALTSSKIVGLDRGRDDFKEPRGMAADKLGVPRQSTVRDANDRSYDPAELLGRIRAVRQANGGTGLGAWRPERVALLVGDRPGPRWGARSLNWPFISALNSGCSSWLAEQLEAAGVREEQLYWVNAYDLSGVMSDLSFISRLKPVVTVALGKNASGAVHAHTKHYVEVHHPQYWKRFHSKERYHLIKILTRSLT